MRSAIAGRQFPQSRCYTAGFADHDKCLVCVYALMEKEGLDPEIQTPTDAILQRCQVGKLHHRSWTCIHSAGQRSKGVSERIVAAAVATKGNDPLGDRGLYPVQTIAVPPKPTEATFVWVLRPPNGILTGTTYTYGSRLDGLVELLSVNGWAFVAVDDTGEPTRPY